ncbi:alpha/beta hydrolase [Nonomuraea rhizosphaerae]|uniref:alpha/beta hydrolase n=1 Tax=Nonomuraea rhizosphaerae TaxID=2665663 RepID=UPI001C60000B|nr:alpha/beta hydrolase-fold protein [Nonomuraea rhizosphaerae]
MGLTSVKLEVLMALAAVAALVATVWWWPRLGGRRWRAVLGRTGVLAGNQVLTLAALGLVANSYFGFYSDWGDLLGTDTTSAPITVAGVGAGIRVLAQHAVRGGRIEQVLMPGPATHLSEEAYVFLPSAYFTDKRERFPAILALTGYPGDPKNLMTRLDLPGRMASAIAERQVKPTILVMMRPSVVLPRDTECVDVPRGPQAQTYFTTDVRQDMISAYRVGAGREYWGVLGGSTGGYCALKFAMSRPEAFSAAVSLSGYYRTIIDGTTGDLFAGDKTVEQRNDLMWRLANLPAPAVNVLVTSSRKGEADYRPTLRFLGAVKPPMQASSLILPSGGHNFNTWNRELPQALPWLAQQLHAPASS